MKNLILIFNLFIVTSLVTAQVHKTDIKKSVGSSISGMIFNDTNNNGIYDLGTDFPQSTGWTVKIQGPVISTATPSADGIYSFTDLPAGTYTVSEIVPDDWTVLSPYWNGTYTLDLNAGENITNKDFANFYLIRSNSDIEYLSFPNGQKTGDNAASPGSGFSPVSSINIGNQLPVNATLVNVSTSGYTPDTFYVTKNQIVQFVVASNDNSASHPTYFDDSRLQGVIVGLPPLETRMVTFKTNNLEVGDKVTFRSGIPGQTQHGVMIVSEHIGSISGKIFNDLNNNGLYDSGTDLLQSTGWSVKITGPVNRTVIPNTDGTYSFKNLPGGVYTVSEVVPQDWTVLSPFYKGSHTVDLSAGGAATDKDFANFYLLRDNSNLETLSFPNGMQTGNNSGGASNPSSPSESFPMTVENLPVNVIHLNVTSSSFEPKTFSIKKNQIVMLAVSNVNSTTFSEIFRFYDTRLSGVVTGLAKGETKMIMFKAYNVEYGETLNFYSSMFDHAAQGATGSMIVQNNSVTAISTSKETKVIKLYPNPVSESFQISGFSGEATLKLLDINGKEVFTKRVNENERIYLNSLSKGLYILRLITTDYVTENKLIKE